MRSTPKPAPNYSKIKKVSKSQKTTYTSSPASKPKNQAPTSISTDNKFEKSKMAKKQAIIRKYLV